MFEKNISKKKTILYFKKIANSLQPTFTWNRIPLVDSFHLQVAKDSLFQNIIYEHASLTDTSFTIDPLSENTKFYWRIRTHYQQYYSVSHLEEILK